MISDQGHPRRPVVLCILDGWGHRTDVADNAITPANTPNFQRLWTAGPHAFIDTCGVDVGLPAGQMGNSEVGHMNLGAGRIVSQDIRRIDSAIEDGLLSGNTALNDFIAALMESGGTAHLLGLLSPGGVHSHQDQLLELARILTCNGIAVAVHAFLDGRDTPPSSAREFIASFDAALSKLPGASIASVCGRFFAMDRDQRWDRVEKAYDLIVSGKGAPSPDAVKAVEDSYAKDVTDEFVEPAIIGGYTGISDGDGVLMGNFRADRAREILLALLDPGFEGFERKRVADCAAALGLTEYSKGHNAFMSTMFPPESLNNLLGGIISDAGKRQLRIAETEKYAHVTFFFNGGEETPFPGEDRVLIPSPKIRTYDLQPEMSAREVTERLVSEISSGKYDFILVNYANPDMVGHTGIFSAAETAIRTVDDCIGRLADAVTGAGGTMLITADHGNAEKMRNDETGQPHTAHTLNVVPAIVVNPPPGKHALSDCRLADIAPTLLEFMGLEQPPEMSGNSLAGSWREDVSDSENRVSV
ncbi:MAG TPA: 2,3-bisphosphoglycerate-independent phosphoglycerate mutase [Rhodospirillaceae bacterium]|nr:2,3-bisphosphoglycerate-independent phosphoglycerate mutase [Rhodospirillaceae bacterium]